MKYGATLMSSFLFNVALVLLSTTAAIQFCAQAFSQYANETAIANIFGGQVGIFTTPVMNVVGQFVELGPGCNDMRPRPCETVPRSCASLSIVSACRSSTWRG